MLFKFIASTGFGHRILGWIEAARPDDVAEAVERAAALHDRTVRILMDLAGPKLRTGPIAPPPERSLLRARLGACEAWPPPRGLPPPHRLRQRPVYR